MFQFPDLRISTDVHEDHIVVGVEGELDIATASQLRSAWRAVPKSTRVSFDLSGVDFIDLTGLDTLLELRPGPLRLVASSRPVRRLIRLSGTDGRFEILEQDKGGA